jgi:hypothetical protein
MVLTSAVAGSKWLLKKSLPQAEFWGTTDGRPVRRLTLPCDARSPIGKPNAGCLRELPGSPKVHHISMKVKAVVGPQPLRSSFTLFSQEFGRISKHLTA